MKQLDLTYLCRTIGNLCGFPVRLYAGEELIFKTDHSGLQYDPIQSCKEDMFTLSAHVATYITPRYYFFGVVRSGETRLILGPTRQLPATEQQLRELAFLSNVPSDETKDFIQAMRALVPMPLESLQQILCTLNYVMNGEKLSLEDIALNDPTEKQIAPAPAEVSDEQAAHEDIHGTLAVEQTLMNMIRKGDVMQFVMQCLSSTPNMSALIAHNEQLLAHLPYRSTRSMVSSFIVTPWTRMTFSRTASMHWFVPYFSVKHFFSNCLRSLMYMTFMVPLPMSHSILMP